MLKLVLSHSILALGAEKRFSPDLTVAELKHKLYPIVGTAPEHQTLQLRTKEREVIRVLAPEHATLASLGLHDYAYVHVVDTDPNRTVAGLTDVSQVEKYQISEEAYEQRSDNFRNFKKKFLKQEEEDPEEVARKQAEKQARLDREAEAAEGIKVGARCEYASGSANPVRGEVVYVGPVHFGPGVWVGIRLDEPFGKNNGTVKGERYFECKPKHGLLTRPTKVKVGDYPERDLLDEVSDSDSDSDIMAEL